MLLLGLDTTNETEVVQNLLDVIRELEERINRLEDRVDEADVDITNDQLILQKQLQEGQTAYNTPSLVVQDAQSRGR